MQAAQPEELKSHAFPVATAHVSKGELSKWFPLPFEAITDPEATPEPSRGALAKLANGLYFVLYWGEHSNELTLRIPKRTNPSDFLAALIQEVPSLKSRFLWTRPDANWPRAKTTGRGFLSFHGGLAAAKTVSSSRSSRKRSSTRAKAPTRKR